MTPEVAEVLLNNDLYLCFMFCNKTGVPRVDRNRQTNKKFNNNKNHDNDDDDGIKIKTKRKNRIPYIIFLNLEIFVFV